MLPLYEQYRPRCWSDVVGQDKALRQIEVLRKRGLSGRAYWLAGPSGTGKTTIARLIAAEVADDWAIEEIDSGTLTPNRVQDIERQTASKPLGGKGWAIIVNEAHGLKAAVVRQLLVTLERLPGHAVWVFTTTTEGELALFDGCDDSHPLLSRCVQLSLARQGLAEPFAKRAKFVAEQAGLDGKPLKSYVNKIYDAKLNLRELFQQIEAGAMVINVA